MKYCPQCGSEYRDGFERCPDCDEPLAERPPPTSEGSRTRPEAVERVDVFITGRRIDAELVRGLLEAHGLNATIWGGGMGAYRLESALTEVTGVPNAFNSYRVGVLADEEEEARALLADVDDVEPQQEPAEGQRSVLELMRSRWALVAAALFLLLFIILVGPAQP